MRRWLMLLLSVLLLFTLVVPASAAEQFQVKVMMDGVELKFDANPFVEDGRTLVPVRHLSEALGFLVGWDESEQKVTLTKDETVIVLWIGSNKVLVNGVEGKIDVPAKKINDRTFVPIRFIAETLNTYVGWDQEQQAAVVLSGKGMMERVTAAQEQHLNQRAYMLMNMTMFAHVPGVPAPMEIMVMDIGTEMHADKGDLLMSVYPSINTVEMAEVGMAVVGGKSYNVNAETGAWELTAEAASATANPFAAAGLEGFDPMKLNAEMMAGAGISVGETVEISGRKLVEIHVDMSQFDMGGLFDALFAELGAALGEEAFPLMEVTTDRIEVSYLVDPATLFVYGLVMDLGLNMTVTEAGESMTMSMSLRVDMEAEPTAEPIEWPAGLKALLEG